MENNKTQNFRSRESTKYNERIGRSVEETEFDKLEVLLG